jgi:hypothetical protein
MASIRTKTRAKIYRLAIWITPADERLRMIAKWLQESLGITREELIWQAEMNAFESLEAEVWWLAIKEACGGRYATRVVGAGRRDRAPDSADPGD